MATNRSNSNRNENSRSQSSQGSRSRSGAMGPEEAGHLGGIAPHSCRGFECQEKSSHKSSSNRSSSESEE